MIEQQHWKRRTPPLALGLLAVSLACLQVTAQSPNSILPAKLNDTEFWSLVERLSEPPGSFRAANYVSNEGQYQSVIPQLMERIRPSQVYLGVGPEQNFSYILAVRPAMAFVIDIRRENLLEHLFYKALFDLSDNRIDFLFRLFSRVRPEGLTDKLTPAELFAAIQRAEPVSALFEQNAKAVVDDLTIGHRFPLSTDDLQAIRNVYHYAFFTAGPNVNYGTGGGGGGPAPTFQELMTTEDGTGTNRSFIATEQSYTLIRNLERQNLVIPIVGDFAGPKAIRAIADYVQAHHSRISAFYVSNVEEFLVRDGRWDEFCRNVATLPVDDATTYIYSGFGPPDSVTAVFSAAPGLLRRAPGVMDTRVRPVLPELAHCAAAK